MLPNPYDMFMALMIFARSPFARNRILTDIVMPGALGAMSLVFLALMVVGLVRWYTPVPFWDMWDAYLAGYIAYLDGDRRALFAQTNEHRIWFSNILFYLDLSIFGGRSLLLVPVNAILALAMWGAFALIARRLLRSHGDLWVIVALSLGPLCLSWLQEQNLSWGFQSQFFAAYLFPLAAFACLAVSTDTRRPHLWFAAAVALGVASLGTMANGLLTLPLLLLMIVMLPRPSWSRAGLVLAIGAVAIFAWFQGYFLVERDRAGLSQIVIFVLTFLGLPFVAIFKSQAAGYAAGLFFVGANAVLGVWWLRRRDSADPLMLALLTFLIYVGASCGIIALGRAAIQPNAALVSRYSTPSLVAWCALGTLLAYVFRNARHVRVTVFVTGVFVACGLLSAQRQVFDDAGPETVQQKLVGALALKLRVADLTGIGHIYPTGTQDAVDHVRLVADWADKKALSIMADVPMAAAVESIGKAVVPELHPCQGVVDAVEVISTDANFRRVTGWIYDEPAGLVPSYAFLVADGLVEGVAASGAVRRDVMKVFGGRAKKSGFTGYVRASTVEAGAEFKIYCAAQKTK